MIYQLGSCKDGEYHASVRGTSQFGTDLLPPGPYKVVLNMDPSVAVHSQSGAPLGPGTVEVGERLVTRFSVAAGR